MMRVAGKDIEVAGTQVEGSGTFRVANSHSGNLDLSSYDIPRPIWKKVNLVNNAAEQQLLMNLESDGKVPLEMVLDMMGLDPKTVRRKLKEQESTPFDPIYRQIREEMGKMDGIREQVLGGIKLEEWEKPDQGLEDADPGAVAPSFKKKPSMGGIGGGGGGGASSSDKKDKPKPPMDFGGSGGGSSAPKAPLDIKTPPPASPGMSPMTPATGLPPAPVAPGGEKAPGMGGTPSPAPGV
jgi:hypothetical protein